MRWVVALVALSAGCVGSGDDCDSVCQAQSGDTAAAATTHWQFIGLGGGNPPSGMAELALFGDHTGKIAWAGIQSRNCPTGSNLAPADFTWSATSADAILFGNGGVRFVCAPTPTMNPVVMTSMAAIVVGPTTFDVDISFGGAPLHFQGTLISGAF